MLTESSTNAFNMYRAGNDVCGVEMRSKTQKVAGANCFPLIVNFSRVRENLCEKPQREPKLAARGRGWMQISEICSRRRY